MLPAPLRTCALAAALLAGAPAAAQRPAEAPDAGRILHEMRGLGVLGNVLYLAAHPDDENTRLISALVNGRHVRTAYLSLTRGDGGQNLIGPELGDALGVVRTQELLEARRIDGGRQFFTRAVDFGFSKSPEEALAKWGHDAVLADVVRVVRTFRPDVIVTRFDTDGSGGHGHHTASARLAHEAFALAGDPAAFPEQLAGGLEPWKPTRLFFNGSTWWKADLAAVAASDPARWVTVDVGGFDPLLGTSYTELAGKSRSQHKSQGFGAAETRGRALEYLRLDEGPAPAAGDLLDGIPLGWERVGEGATIGALVDALVARHDPAHPERSLAQLGVLVRALDALATRDGELGFWARVHGRTARALALELAGVVVEASAPEASVPRGETRATTVSVLQRGAGPRLELVALEGPGTRLEVGEPLPENQALARELPFTAAPDEPLDQPYWLAAPHGDLYRPAAGHGIEPVLPARAWSAILRLPDGLELRVERPLFYTWVDRVAGQRTRPVVVTPVASIEPVDPVALVPGARVSVPIEVEALVEGLEGRLEVTPPAGWTLEGTIAPLGPLAPGARGRVSVELRRGPEAPAGVLHLAFSGPRGTSDRTRHAIDYPHLLPQTWYAPAEVRLVPLDVKIDVHTVGFLEGVGDDVPRALQRLGITVERLDPASAGAEDLERCDAIVTGIRAYNTVPALARLRPLLLEFVARGGTLLVQYNTAGGELPGGPPGPLPFALTRARVTVEETPPTFLAPGHPLMTTPNALGGGDFAGWVQERGLYFAGELDPGYVPLIRWSDPGEEPQDGALITCDWGQGRFTYTGLSLFRQLPVGVPGAYRLLANLVARRSPRE